MAPVKATLTCKQPNIKVEVDFNPQSLRVSYRSYGSSSTDRAAQGQGTTSGQKTGGSSQRTGFTTGLSSLELLFDTSETGADVREKTLKIAQMLHIPETNVAPTVVFQWGTFYFTGSIDSMDETLDYFSDEGKPLRATVALTMSMIEERKDSAGGGAGTGAGAAAGFGASASAGFSAGASAGFSAGASVGASAGFSASASVSAGIAVGTTPLTLSQAGESLQTLSARSGADWRAVAEANNIDNPRTIQAGTVLDLNASVSASASFGIG